MRGLKNIGNGKLQILHFPFGSFKDINYIFFRVVRQWGISFSIPKLVINATNSGGLVSIAVLHDCSIAFAYHHCYIAEIDACLVRTKVNTLIWIDVASNESNMEWDLVFF